MTSPSAAPTGPLEPGTEAPDFALRSTPDQLLSLSECRGPHALDRSELQNRRTAHQWAPEAERR